MGLIDDELDEVSRLCPRHVEGSRIISCVPCMVRVEIRKTVHKALVVCIQFPEDYPREPLLVELKSKTLSEKLILKLTKLCDEECKKYLGKPQILKVLVFLRKFLDENPLCVCFDEINHMKSLLNEGELRIKQKSSKLVVHMNDDAYYTKAQFVVPDEYPVKSVSVDVDSNLPPAIKRYLLGQAREKARQCVEPPLKKDPKAPSFAPQPSLEVVAVLIINAARLMSHQMCQGCGQSCLPASPTDIVTDENDDFHIERLFCNHLFHLKCLMIYMKTPPFQGGKKCPACGERIYHDKWRVSERLAEERWAHQQARLRELEEVTDFFN